jgi:type IV secretion system protein TrbL
MSVGVETPNELMVVFSNAVSAGFDALQGSVNGVFGLMIALVVALTGVQWALSSNREVLASGFGKVLLIGLFAWLINDWQRLSETLYAGFIELGLTAGGSGLNRSDFLNPGAILAQGWEIVKALGETPAPVDNPLDVVGNMADALILGLAMLGVMLAFAVLALQIIVALLEFKIVTLGGFVLLPFGIWSKSAFLAERPLGYVVSSGLKVLALAIVVSGARTVFDRLQPSANPDIYEALSILVAALLLAMLSIFVPNLASALVTGGPALGAGAAATGALAVGGTAALGAAGVAGAGAAASGAATRLSGTARAAAGAHAARAGAPPPSGPSGPPSPPRPFSNGGPTPGGPRPSGGGGRAAGGVPDAKAASGSPAGDEADEALGRAPGRPAAVIDREAEAARRDFHWAAGGGGGTGPDAARPPARSAALQAFFVANAGRGLLPAGEGSGALSPNLKTEEP